MNLLSWSWLKNLGHLKEVLVCTTWLGSLTSCTIITKSIYLFLYMHRAYHSVSHIRKCSFLLPWTFIVEHFMTFPDHSAFCFSHFCHTLVLTLSSGLSVLYFFPISSPYDCVFSHISHYLLHFVVMTGYLQYSFSQISCVCKFYDNLKLKLMVWIFTHIFSNTQKTATVYVLEVTSFWATRLG